MIFGSVIAAAFATASFLLHRPATSRAGGATTTTINSKSQLEDTTCEVCLSPACLSSGAQETLDKLQALAPPNVQVQARGCVSLCSYGPVVVTTTTGADEQKYRKVAADGTKLLDILVADSGFAASEDLIQGYDLAVQANDLFDKKQYAAAVELYEQVIQVSFRAAMDLQAERVNNKDGLQWLIRARRNEAAALLELKRLEDALLAAQAACNLSGNTCSESFGVLAKIYRAQNGDNKNTDAEFQALETMFTLAPINPETESALPFPIQSQRRTLSLRYRQLQLKRK